MLDRNQIRPTLNEGRYLFFNRWLRLAIGCADWLIGLVRPSPAESTDVIPRRILVSLQTHLGDTIIASSVLPVLRAAFPDARIGALIHPGSAPVIEGHPDIEWVHRYLHWRLDKRPVTFMRKLRDYLRSRREALDSIRSVGYDLAIDLYAYFPNSIPLIFASGIPVRLGWTSGGFGGLLTHAVDWPGGPELPVIEWHKRILSVLPACRPFLELARPTLCHSDDAMASWERTKSANRIGDDYIVFHIGAGAPMKQWPEANWQRLGQRFSAHGLTVVLLGYGPTEEALARRLAEQIPGSIHLAGELSWKEMAECIAGARLLVGHDSGAVHIAAAWDVPSACITTGINSDAWKPNSAKALWIVTPTPCSPCHMHHGCDGMECIRLTTADTVYGCILEVLPLQPLDGPAPST